VDASEVRLWCLRQAGAIEDFPFGPEHSVFKVAGKMFALSALDRTPLEVSVKCDPEHLIEDSFDLVVSALPKRVREQLGWPPAT
jgi:predicted DNA-binding protein (MmcQ/YjbR family)